MSAFASRPATRMVLGALGFMSVVGLCVGAISGLAYFGMHYLRLASSWGAVALSAIVVMALVALVYAVLGLVDDRLRDVDTAALEAELEALERRRTSPIPGDGAKHQQGGTT